MTILPGHFREKAERIHWFFSLPILKGHRQAKKHYFIFIIWGDSVMQFFTEKIFFQRAPDYTVFGILIFQRNSQHKVNHHC